MVLKQIFLTNMKNRRKQLGLTQEKLAEICNTDSGYIRQIEIGRRFPSLEYIERIAKALNTAPFRLFYDESERGMHEMYRSRSLVMKQGIQSFLKTIGDSACLVLTMIKIAERHTGKEIDPIAVIEASLDNKWLEPNMLVAEPEKIMEYMTGQKWSYTQNAIAVPDEPGRVYTIERWDWVWPNGSINHFRLKDWDSLADSLAVKNGELTSYWVLRLL